MADYGDLVQFLGPIEMDTAINLPDDSWENRFATHNLLTVPVVDGERPLISFNLATQEGGGLHLTEASEAHMVEVDFTGNVALGEASGAAYCGTSTTIKSFGCSFVDNSAPNGHGGAVAALSETVVEILHSTALQNTAKFAGGVGSFEGSATLIISNTTMESNGLLGGTIGGGALRLYGVRDATITKSGFFNNSVGGLGGDGGAVMAIESKVNFEGVQFSHNVAAEGDGNIFFYISYP